jgi:serine/threonine protein kinase
MQLCDKTLEDIIDVFENDSSLKNDDMLTPLGYYIAGQIFIEILEAVNHLHEHKPPLIHRDLKPGNILLNRKSNDRFVKIGDFGLATLHEMIGQSHTGTNVQTPKYIAPEVDTKEYTTKADIYSLGAILIDIFDIYEDRY